MTTITYENKTYVLMTDELFPWWRDPNGERVKGDFHYVLTSHWIFGN